MDQARLVITSSEGRHEARVLIGHDSYELENVAAIDIEVRPQEPIRAVLSCWLTKLEAD